jgi:hypothetical protein
MRYLVSLIMAMGLVSGCDKAPAPKTKSVIPVEEVPAIVMNAAKKKERDVKFDKVMKTPDGIYEVQGKNKGGKVIEVEVSEAGEVLKVE